MHFKFIGVIQIYLSNLIPHGRVFMCLGRFVERASLKKDVSLCPFSSKNNIALIYDLK